MKNKKIYRFIIILFVTIVALWAIPALVKIATVEPQNYPFVYYSSVVNKFCLKETQGKISRYYDTSGTQYTLAQYDSILPMLNYRQLMVNGLMPDSIQGIAIDPKLIRVKSFVFKYAPTDIHTPDMGLYIMYESLSGRVSLESPGDVFRLKDRIEFIDINSNKVSGEKSRMFQKELEKREYSFPAKWTSGNMNIRKPYDEGYFSLDSQGQLYHIKMVNAKPFIRNTLAGKKIDIKYFSLLEVADKRFYGFIFDKTGNIYILSDGDGKYDLTKLDMEAIDLDKDEVMIMANMFYWTVSVSGTQGKKYYALDNASLKRVDSYEVAAKPDKWEKISAWLFPYHLTFSEKNSNYFYPRVHFNGYYAILLNILLAVTAVLFVSAGSWKTKVLNLLYVLFTGLAGIIAILLIPTSKK